MKQPHDDQQGQTPPGGGTRALDGRVALVTGGSSGIGLQIAEHLAQAGAFVAVNGRTETTAAAAADRIPGAFAAPFDVTDSEACASAIQAIVARLERLDILVCSAAMRDRRPFASMNAASFRRVLEVNLVAPFELARAAAPYLGLHGQGRVILISSTGAQRPYLGDAAYASSKAGLEGLMRSLAWEFGPLGITVNAVAPGFTSTEFNHELVADARVEAFVHERVPLRRWGAPAEIARACLFLASDAGAYVSGHVLTVDGGLTSGL